MKSAESNRKTGFQTRHESCPEVDGVAYMPGVGYPWWECMKILTKFRMYESKRWCCRKAVHLSWWYLWASKIGCYESPCTVTGGAVMHDQIQAQSKNLKISNDRNIGTWKAGNVWKKPLQVVGRESRAKPVQPYLIPVRVGAQYLWSDAKHRGGIAPSRIQRKKMNIR